MAKVVKVIELMSQSPKSWEDAVQGCGGGSHKDTPERSLHLHQGIHR